MRCALLALLLAACGTAPELDAGTDAARPPDPLAYDCREDDVPLCPAGSAAGCLLNDRAPYWWDSASLGCVPGDRRGLCEDGAPVCPGESVPRCVWPSGDCGWGCTGVGIEGCSY